MVETFAICMRQLRIAQGKIEYVSLTSDRLQEAIEVLRNAFFPYENVCIATQVSKSPETLADFDEMIIDTAKHGVSLAAVDKETGRMVGIILNKIQHKNTSSKKFYENYINKAKYPQAKEVFMFMINMEDAVDPFTPYGADCLMELVFLGVLPEYSKRGIGCTLSAVSIEVARSLNKGDNVKVSLEDNTTLPLEPRPQVVTALFTSFKTQKIGRKLGFDILKTVNCEELYYDEKSYGSIIGNETKGFTAECKKV